MYLGALNVRMPDGSIRQAAENDLQAIGNLVHAGGGVPLRPDGNPYLVSQAFGGDLWSGCPIFVAIEESGAHNRLTWLPSQPEILRAAGMIPACLIPGSPNYQAFYGSQGGAPNSGTGTRTVTTMVPPQPGGAAVLPTGVATPTLLPMPGGTPQYLPPELGEDVHQAEVATEEESGGGSWWPWIIAAAFLLPKVAAGGYVAHRYYKRRQAARSAG